MTRYSSSSILLILLPWMLFGQQFRGCLGFVVSPEAPRKFAVGSILQHQSMAVVQAAPLVLFGSSPSDPGADDDKTTAELARYPSVVGSGDGLVRYLQTWAEQLKLTTPASVVHPSGSGSVQILFRDVPSRGYGDKDQEDDDKYGDNKKDKKEKVKPGGVEILVEEQDNDGGLLQVRVRRCATDEDTMIKEMSEETILKELKVALDVWKRDH